MKKVEIKYNPYLIKTEVRIDGKSPNSDSSLDIKDGMRIQEWIESFPQNLKNETGESNFDITFTGITENFEDVKSAFEATNDIAAQVKHNCTKDINDVEKEIDAIFADIQKGPIDELRDPSIKEAFNKAKNSVFDVNVVATMSSGKSTLINSLLQKELMPAENLATTATIVKINDTDQENYHAIAYNAEHKVVKEIKDISLKDMQELNKDTNITEIVINGKIPFVKTVGMKLTLVDTPGPNNSRTKDHEVMTYSMLKNSDKSLVLYVMNGTQSGVNDETNFLNYVCQTMKEGGKQGRERYIFAVNKMDSFHPKKEGSDCINRALDEIRKSLEDRGIVNPNIFPITALSALELRTDVDVLDQMALDRFKKLLAGKNDCLHFENYYNYSNLPQSIRQSIEKLKAEGGDDDVTEIHTGIITIESAIRQYITKYARTMKVCDLVESFNGRVKELSAFENLKKKIQNDKNAKAKLEKEIEDIQEKINSGKNAQSLSSDIDAIDLTKEVKSSVQKIVGPQFIKCSNMLTDNSKKNKVPKDTAMRECENIEKQMKSISSQVKVDISKMIEKSYTETYTKVIDTYKQHLAKLGFGSSQMTINPLNLVVGNIRGIKESVSKHTQTVDESYNENYQAKVEGGFLRKAASWFTFGWVDDYTYETRTRRVQKFTDYVDMYQVSYDYINPIQTTLENIKAQAVNYVQTETDALKSTLKSELTKLNNMITQKLNDLKNTKDKSDMTANEIKVKEGNLKWLQEIQDRVNNLIEF